MAEHNRLEHAGPSAVRSTIGYDVVNRQLVINPDEAAVVRRIFEEMLTIGSPTQIATPLSDEGITTKAWTTQDGRVRSGTRIDKKYLHKVLRNRIYLGELSNRGTWFPGGHPPIIERELWDKVHAVLARDSHTRGVDTKIRSRNDALVQVLRAQSERLATVQSDLDAARRALDERKLIERAKGVLMERFQISEDAAHVMMRKAAMDRNLRLVDVAQAGLSLPTFLPQGKARP